MISKHFWNGFEKVAVREFLFKRKYKMRDIDKLDYDNPEEAWTAKIDGAHAVINMKKGALPFHYSHRISKRTGNPIEYSSKLPHVKRKSKLDAVVRGEVFAVDGKGRASAPEVMTSILNSKTDKSLNLQKERKLKTQTALIDVDTFQGKNVSGESFATKRKILEQIVAGNPDFTLPDIASTPQEKKKLLRDIQKGRNKQTKEGLIVHRLTDKEHPFYKAKITDDHDVYVRQIFAESDVKKGRKAMSGGFEYSWEPDGKIVGRVGTGFNHAMKEDMLHNPQNYIGRVAKVKALDISSKSRALQKPSFMGWHIDKNID